jgi:hypothetical protein
MQTFDSEPNTGRSAGRPGSPNLVARGWRHLVLAWRHGVHIQERLLELSRPWEAEGAMRWQRRSDGWRLVGEHLPPFPG